MPRPCSSPRRHGRASYQLAQIASGKDAANMDPHENPDFYAQAMFKGGGLGIFGDLSSM
jgi:hypothetical protein